MEVAKQLAKTSQDIFFITSGAESSKEERDRKEKKKKKKGGGGKQERRSLDNSHLWDHITSLTRPRFGKETSKIERGEGGASGIKGS